MKYFGKPKKRKSRGTSQRDAIRKAGIIDHILAFLGAYKMLQVAGTSMWPLLADGDIVFMKRKSQYDPHDIVIARHPYRKMSIIKQIDLIEGDSVYLASLDRIEGEDSSSFGPIQTKNIMGKIYAKT